jgi:CubicO group peptidase (beta-lactamase class C family)
VSVEHPPLPAQPSDVPWPTEAWPEAEPGADVDAARLRDAGLGVFTERAQATTGRTLALVAVHRGRLVFEQYEDGKGADDTFRSWSMAKSMVHALVGMQVADGKLQLHGPAPVPRWHTDPADPRGSITLDHLLRMLDGLDFVEIYEGTGQSDVIDMIYGEGKEDVAAFSEARPLAHRPGTWWNYSSGTSNIVCALLGRSVGGGEPGMRRFMQDRFFGPLGMQSAAPRFDPAGTFIGSSFCFATAQDFARFGLLYLRGGVWEGRRLLPEHWVDHARTRTPASSGHYGAHWWLALDGSGIFGANGFRGQYIVVDPSRDLVLVRLGASTPEQRVHVVRMLRDVVECFPLLSEQE